MAGRRSPQGPSISQLTSPLDSITSCRWRLRHIEFQQKARRHPLTDSTPEFSTSNLCGHATPPPQIQRLPAKLAKSISRRCRIVLIREGEVLGTVEAGDAKATEKVAAIQFELDEFQRRRLLVQELAR